MLTIRRFEPSDESAVTALWLQVFDYGAPRHRPDFVLSLKREHDDGLLLVALWDGALCGTAMGGYDGHRGWLYTVAVDPGLRRRGVGRALVQAMEHELVARGAPKINLQVRGGNEAVVGFYEALGYAVEPHLSLGKIASAIVQARAGDFPAIAALLDAASLTLEGVEDLLPSTLVARHEGELVGSVCLERFGELALLRSLCVRHDRRGSGLGTALVEAARERARCEGVRALYLLTETAARFFGARGFTATGRDSVPPAIRASRQFASLCPASAQVMCCALRG